jgi:hypothetical protein
VLREAVSRVERRREYVIGLPEGRPSFDGLWAAE